MTDRPQTRLWLLLARCIAVCSAILKNVHACRNYFLFPSTGKATLLRLKNAWYVKLSNVSMKVKLALYVRTLSRNVLVISCLFLVTTRVREGGRE